MKRYIVFILVIMLSSCFLSEAQVWDKEIEKFEEADKTIDYPSDAILFAGSSSIRLWTTIEDDMYPYPVIQRGFGGSRLNDLIVYADRIFKPHQCRAIVLFVANDITGSDKDKSPEEIVQLFKNVLKIIRTSHPETPVFWIEVTPTSSRWKVWPAIKESTSLIRKVCENENNLFSIRTDFAFLNEDGIPRDELFVSDKLHLNEKGYEIWSGIIRKEIMRILED